MNKKIDLYLITGFLGSGKTTFLKEVIKSTDKKIGIIMNEFGKEGIDGKIVEDGANELIEINRGSIFCDCLKLSFVESLKDMSEKPIDALFVEGSGLADPSNISEILDATKLIVGDKYNYCGSICLVDSLTFMDLSDELEALERQVKHSHLAVISKADLLENIDLAEIKTKILKYNSQIQITEANNGKLSFDFFKDWKPEIINIIKDETTNKKENKPKTLTLEIKEIVEKDKLISFLEKISVDAYRLKGFVKFEEDKFTKVDVVNGKLFFEPSDYNEGSKIVIISKVGPSIIRTIVKLWESEVNVKYKLKN